MANRFYIGPAGGAWNVNANWGNISGGGGPQSFPTVADDVFIDGGSAGNAPQLDANRGCKSLDALGAAGGTLDLNGFTLEVRGGGAPSLFRLVVALAIGFGGAPAARQFDFTAVAGTTQITPANHDLGATRFGNGGAGGTFQTMGAMGITGDLDFVNGTFDTGGNAIGVGRDMFWRATCAASSFKAGASAISVARNFDWQAPNIMQVAGDYGTSQFLMTGTGNLSCAAGCPLYFYDLYVGTPGQVTTYNGTNATSTVYVVHQFTSGAGTFAYANGLFRVMSPQANAFNPNAGLTMQVPMTWEATPAGALTALLPPCVYQAAVTLYHSGVANAVGWQLTAAVTIAADLTLRENQANTDRRFLDLNGFNLSVANLVSGAAGDRGFTILVGARTLTVTGGLTMVGVAGPDPRLLQVGTGGQVLVTGSLVYTGALVSTNVISLLGTALLRVGADWTSNAATAPVFQAAWNADTATVTFAAPGAMNLLARPDEWWPSISFSGGAVCALPNGFNCYALAILAGNITAGNPFTVRSDLANGGTFTGGPNMFIGSSFVNTGVVVMAGTTVTTFGPLFSVGGFDPVTLNMGPQTQRLQLVLAMNITTLNILPRTVPGVVQFLAGGAFNVGTINSQVTTPDAPVQFVSSVAGTQYALSIGVATSLAHIWPRDWDATGGIALVGDQTNKGLGHNAGWTLNGDGQVRVIEEDPGRDELAAGAVGPVQYCWLVGTSLVNLTAVVAAFAAGADNYHRKTNIPFGVLDNLNIGTQYWVGLGMIDDRGRRLAPNMVAGDFATAFAGAGGGGGGGAHPLFVNVKGPFVG